MISSALKATDTHGISADEANRVDQFLGLFTEVESLLKLRLGRRASDRTPISSLIESYTVANPRWGETATILSRLCGVRNIIVHERTADDGYPLLIPGATLRRIREIHCGLSNPEPVSAKFSRAVTTVVPEDTLLSVLRIAYEKEYSQFPVLSGGRFRGLVTENGVTRHLGRHAKARRAMVDLQAITIGEVLRDEEQERECNGKVYTFVRADSPVDEVMGLFSNHPMLEAALLTRTGRSGSEPLLGIVTEWDASRFR